MFDVGPPPKLWTPPKPAIIRAGEIVKPVGLLKHIAVLPGMMAVPGSEIGGNDSFTKLLLHCDGADASTTFTDASPSAHGNATVAGTAQVDTAQSKFGGASLLLDGDSDYLTYANHADFQFGSGDFTIDFWVRFTAITGTRWLLGRWQGVAATLAWLLRFEEANGLALYIYDGAAQQNVIRAWSPSISTWYHIAAVRVGNVGRLFVDGAQLGADGSITIASQAGTSGLEIGGTSSGAFLNGWMDEIRISKGIARWTTTFTPPIGPYS